MLVFYKSNTVFITEHATDPDKRKNVLSGEGPKHYIDIDRYGIYPYPELPPKWGDAIAKYSRDTLLANGIVPWHIQIMLARLTTAFKEKKYSAILRYSADIGHYIADAHVPLHTNSNYDGQLTDQKGIHAFWESRIPELFADKEFDFFIGRASYLVDPGAFIWARVIESGIAADSVLLFERVLSKKFASDKKFAFEPRNKILLKQYSYSYSKAYNGMLDGMIERRMRQAIYAVASFWYTAWVNAGQPNLADLTSKKFSESDQKEFEKLNQTWKNGKVKTRDHEE